jgi:hypothetical protein
MSEKMLRFAFASFIVLAFTPLALAGIELDTEPAVVGNEVTLTVLSQGKQPAADAPVKVTYYPNSEIKRTVEVGRTDERGQLRWTPEHAGLSTIAAGEQTKTIGVRFDGMPLGALVVFLIAGTLLFGGIAFGVSRLR